MAGGCPISLPTDRESQLDPPSLLDALRTDAPVCPLRYPDGHVGWLVTSYELARSVLLDPRLILGVDRPVVGDPDANAAMSESLARIDANCGRLDFADPPDHMRLRQEQVKHFRVSEVARQLPAIERIIDERLDAMAELSPPVDFVEVFALPVPSLAICHLLGVPGTDRHRFEHLTHVQLDPDARPEDLVNVIEEFRVYLDGVIARKRDAPGDDLLSELAASGSFPDDELKGIAQLLFEAGHETTANMLALSVFTLLSEPDRWRRLLDDPESVDAAVEELLRYLTIIHTGFIRTAREETKIGDVVVQPGQSVAVSLAAANRDPARFPGAEALDLGRDARGHVAFGYGRHMCLGQHLARIELRVALGRLMTRFPNLHLACAPGDVSLFSGERFVYGVRELPVGW